MARGPQVGLDNGRVPLDLRWAAGGDDLAEAEHYHPLGDGHHQAHVVLDEQHTDAELAVHAADDAGQLDFLRRVGPGRRFVQEQQLRPGAERPGNLQAAPVPVRERAGQVVGALAEADEVEQLEHPAVALALLAPGAG